MKFTPIKVLIFDYCDEQKEPLYKETEINVIECTETQESLKFLHIALIEGQQCKESECFAAVPDAWLIRPEHERPQMIIQFGEVQGNKIGSPKYPITIPHPKSSKPSKSSRPAYKKGNWEAIFVLKDNSKVTVHAFNEAEAMKVINAAKQLIIPEYVNGGYLSKSCMVVTK